MEQSCETIKTQLYENIPENDIRLYDGKLKSFSDLYVTDLEQLLKSPQPNISDIKKLFINTSLCPITPLFNHLWKFDTYDNIRTVDLCDNIRLNAKVISDLAFVKLTETSNEDYLTWYSNLIGLFTIQMQSNMAIFYHKILQNIEARSKLSKNIPCVIPYPDLEPTEE